MNRRLWLVAGMFAASVALAGCGTPHSESAAGSTEQDRPAQVLQTDGAGVSPVVLTARAAERIGLKTERVREVTTAGAGTGTGSSTVPIAALVYDKSGGTWVYANTQRLTFVRQRVNVARIESDLAVLQAGPAPGTEVATVGAAELLGSEYGVEGQ
jgi:hypothetical protein